MTDCYRMASVVGVSRLVCLAFVILFVWSSFGGDGRSIHFNPLTVPARKFSGLKSAHIHACKQHIWQACRQTYFQYCALFVEVLSRAKKGQSLNPYKLSPDIILLTLNTLGPKTFSVLQTVVPSKKQPGDEYVISAKCKIYTKSCIVWNRNRHQNWHSLWLSDISS